MQRIAWQGCASNVQDLPCHRVKSNTCWITLFSSQNFPVSNLESRQNNRGAKIPATTDYVRPERKQPSLHGHRFTPTPKCFVCHIGPALQISLIYAFIGCPQSVPATNIQLCTRNYNSEAKAKINLLNFCKSFGSTGEPLAFQCS